MQKGGEGVQIACKIAYVINGRPPSTGYVAFILQECKDLKVSGIHKSGIVMAQSSRTIQLL